jgi:hypothetical protein
MMAITNIFNDIKIADKYQITYNSKKDNAFIVPLTQPRLQVSMSFNASA